MKTNLFVALFLVVIFFAMPEAKAQDFEVVEEIILTDDNPGEYAEAIIAKGGKFTKEGWQSTDSLSQVVIVLRDGFEPTESGAIEMEISNFNPLTQRTGKKQHFFSLYANPEGMNWIDEFRDGEYQKKDLALPFFNFRVGTYDNEEGRGIKMLWKADAERHEEAPFGARKDWSEDKTYTWKAVWDADSLSCYLDGEKIFGPVTFGPRTPHSNLRYIFLSKGGMRKDNVWFGMPGPVYKKIRVYRNEETERASADTNNQ